MKKINSTLIDLILFCIVGCLSLVVCIWSFTAQHYIMGVVYLVLVILDLKVVWQDFKILKNRSI